MAWHLIRCARLLGVILVFISPVAARAQVTIYPPPITGQATMSVTTSSIAINAANLAAGLVPNSAAFPTGRLPHSYLRVKVQDTQTAVVTVCWLGGSCATNVGEVIAVGESGSKGIPWNIGSQPPTVIAASGTVIIEVEW